MTRLAAIVIAVLACAICVEAALYVAGILEPWLRAHMVAHWFVPVCNLVTIGIGVGVAVTMAYQKKAVVKEDERLTPVVRRDPQTGLRRL